MSASSATSASPSKPVRPPRFRLTPAYLARLDAEMLPEAVLEKIRPLENRTYEGEAAFVSSTASGNISASSRAR